jgi:two-component system, sensor histidine kinase and response regulator
MVTELKPPCASNPAGPAGQFVMDGNGTVVEWDEGAQALFGWRHAEVVGRKLSELILPERFRTMHEEGLERFKATGRGAFVGKTLELKTLHRDGHEFSVEITISMEKTADGYRFPTIARAPVQKHGA